MPIAVEWIFEDRVILSTFTGRISKAGVESWLETLQYMVELGLPKVHHIYNTTDLETIKIDADTFYKMLRTIPRNRRVGWHVEVTRQSAEHRLSPVISQFTGSDTCTHATLAEAITFLQQHDDSLQNLEASHA